MSPFKSAIRHALTAFAFSLTAASALASYTITRSDGGNNTLLVAGREYEFLITNIDTPKKLQDVNIELTTANFDILVAPGVQTGSNKYSLDSNGQLVISLRIHRSGTFSMTVKNSQDPANKGTLNSVQVQNYPVSYAITPTNPTVNANTPFNISVTALDINGVVVTAYEDSVQIVDSQLGAVTLIDGSNFVNGQASNIPVTVKAGNLNNQFTLTITLAGARYYDPSLPAPSLAPAATKTTSLINLIPDAFSKLVLLFPGETLSPGIGKTGTPLTQESLVPVSIVTVQRVDQFYNPLRDNPTTPLSIQFTSSASGPDNPPFPFTLSMTGPLLSIPAASNQIYFGGAGPRVVSVVPDGDATKLDSSALSVNVGAAESYQITVVGVAPNSSITTDDIRRVEIRAFDQNGSLLSTLFGRISGAELRAQLGSGEEKKEWVDTNTTTDFPENDIIFGCATCGGGGIAVMNVSVTKFGSDVRYHFVTPLRDVFSIPFNVDPGAPNRIHLTVRGVAPTPTQGETWTPGTYPGNSGTPPVTTAGQDMVVEARITDRRWNLISGSGSSYNMQVTNNLPEHYLQATNPAFAGPIYQFPNNGEFSYDSTPAFDKSFRVRFRTAGPSSLVSAPRIRVTSNLSVSAFLSSSMTVTPAAYSKLVLQAPGETIQPGIDTEADGKLGSPTARQAGVAFSATAFATDVYFNPVINPPFPNVNFTLTPSLPGSFISGALPAQMVSGSRGFTITLQASTDVRLFDVATPAIQQTVPMTVSAGVLHHFAMDTVASPQKAGLPFTVTVRALDQFENVVPQNLTVTVAPNTGAGTMTPSTIDLVNGVYTGNFTMFAATPTAKITMSIASTPSATRDSNSFAVQVSPIGYQKLLLLLPGENSRPGTATGKSGTPNASVTGSVFIARVIACDPYYNPIDTTGSVMLASNHLAQFGSATGSFVNVNGHGEYSTTVILKNATVHTITVLDVNNDATVTRSTSTIQGQVGGYRRLQILAAGESNNPDSVSGKSGTPLAQKVATPFNLVINAVDDNWNIVTTFNGGDTRLAGNISAVLFLPPNNIDAGGSSPRPFINGSVTRQAVVGQQGPITLTASDDANLTKPNNAVDVTINPGPVYVFQTPANAIAGQAFAPVTITLEEGGVPVSGYNRSIFLTADLVSGGTASGSFNPDNTPREYVMSNGVVTINDLSFAYSENIKIRLADEFARIGFSNAIDVVPSGLKYRITVPATPVVAGPPTTFPVIVELLDQNTNTLVKNHDHSISVQVVSAESPTTVGSAGVTSAVLAQGVASFQQSYTKAENILVKIGESATAGEPTYSIPDGNSVNVTVIADTYKKLLLLAPNETQTAGVISATGKTGNPANAQKDVAFLMQVRGVDQYWNTVNQFNGGAIVFDSNDLPASIAAGNPSNQGAALVNGESASNIALHNPGDVQITVRDTSNSAIAIQSVIVRVGGLYYVIDGEPSQQFTGSGAPFSISVTLYDSNTNLPVTSANQAIQLQAMLPNGNEATGLLGVMNGQLSNGTANITDEHYSIAENIFIRVTDALGNSGSSDVISFVPRQIRYTIVAPAEATVNKPFHISVKVIDAFTNSEVKNLNRTIQLSALSAITGQAVQGSFLPTSVNVGNGVGEADPIYTIAEPIAIQVTDLTPSNAPGAPTQPTFIQQGTINIHPGPLATIDGISDFQMQSNEGRTFNLIARDESNNPIPAQKLVFRVQSQESGSMAINGETGPVTVQANGQGELSVRFQPSTETNGRVEIQISDGDVSNGYATLVVIDVLGLSRRPASAPELGGNRIPVNTKLPLDINLDISNGGTIRTYYRLDNGPWRVYDPNVGAEGFTETKRYTVEWYSEVCYDNACTNPVNELAINGAPNFAEITTYVIDNSISGYPNPFNPKNTNGNNFITIQYPLAQASSVEINIYDLMGQKVWHKDISAGEEGGQAKTDNRVFWFGTNDDGMVVANGGYITTVKVGSTGQLMNTKILVVK